MNDDLQHTGSPAVFGRLGARLIAMGRSWLGRPSTAGSRPAPLGPFREPPPEAGPGEALAPEPIGTLATRELNCAALRMYGRAWLRAAFFPWALVGVAYLAGLIVSILLMLAPCLILLEVLLAVAYLSPIAAGGAARERMAGELQDMGVDGFLIARTGQRWPFAMFFLSLLATAVPAWLALGSTETFLQIVLAARVILFVAWILLCARTADQVGVLRWGRDPGGKRALVLEQIRTSRFVEVTSVNVDAREVHLLESGEASCWASFEPVHILQRDLRHGSQRAVAAAHKVLVG